MPYERKTVDIYISDDLRNVLSVIESESLVAALLLKRRHNREDLADSYVNYISISKQDRTKLSYLSQDRIDSLDPQEYWTSSRRYMAKPGAFISKLFNDVPAKEVEKFSNLLRSQAKKAPFRFEVVRGNSIKDFYYYENYHSSERGSLGVSCMKHEHCQKYFDLYTENEDNVSMLTMFNENNRLIGRALLWDFESHKIMDRIYTYNDEELSFYFKQWATEHGYYYKSEQNWFNTIFFEQIGTGKKEFKLEMKLPNIKQHYYPYMDTFKFIDLDKGILYNYLPEDTSSLRTLTSSDGSKHPSDYLVFDMIDRVMRYRNDAAYVQYAEIWTGRQNVVYSNYNDKWMLKQDSHYEELIDDYIFNEQHNDKNSDRVLKLIEQRRKEQEERKSGYEKSSTKSKLSDITNELESVLGSIDTRGWGELRHPDTITQLFERSSGGRPTRRTAVRAREDVADEPDMQVEASSTEPTRTYSSRWAQVMGNSTGVETPTPVEEVRDEIPFEDVRPEQTTFTYNSDMWTSNNWSDYEEDRDEELCTEDENPF
jgi:hypothetical protein